MTHTRLTARSFGKTLNQNATIEVLENKIKNLETELKKYRS